MSDTTLHTVLINRMWSNVLYDYASMKNIKNFTIKHNNHGELKPYEKQFGRELTRLDAIIISPLTKDEINKIIDSYHTNKELLAFQEKKSKETLELYYRDYGKDA